MATRCRRAHRGACPGRGGCDARRYAGGVSTALARCISILAHPVATLALGLVAVAAGRGVDAQGLRQVAFGCVMVAGVVMAYSAWRVRRGDWHHVDASARGERRHLNGFLLPVLLGAALLSWAADDATLGLQLAAAAVPVAAGLATARWCHLSLHVAFAVFAAVLLAVAWPGAGIAMLAVAGLVAWSRRVLGRHAMRDLVAGAASGVVAGLLASAPAVARHA